MEQVDSEALEEHEVDQEMDEECKGAEVCPQCFQMLGRGWGKKVQK